jgi:hypothetical protein
MFRLDFFDAMLGIGLALGFGFIHLVAQLRLEEEEGVDWREPLLHSLIITATMTLSEALQGIWRGDGLGWHDPAEMAVLVFPFIAAGSLTGRGAGWMLQRL